MNLKKIKAMPFAPFCEESGVRWKVTVKEPVVDGERLLVVIFWKTPLVTYTQETHPPSALCAPRKAKR